MVITSEGMAASRGRSERPTKPQRPPTRANAAERPSVQAVEAPAPSTEADGAATPAKRRAKAKAAKPGKAAPAEKPTPRAGTKQALMIELLKRPEGATVERMRRRHRLAAPHHPRRHHRRAQEEARPHRRGHRTREVGPNKTGAKGSATTYRIAA